MMRGSSRTPKAPLGLVFAAALGAGTLVLTQTTTALMGLSTVPDLSGVWFREWRVQQLFEPPNSGFGPVVGDPAWPHIRGQNSPWIAELSNPILQPRARSRLKDIADRQKAGLAMLDNDSLCLPVGVLGSLNMFDAMEVLQTPDAVILLYERDHQIRHIYLNVAHSDALGPTWYGDSIGHYEGDTLVVDTIGMNTKTLVDRYGTPHSDNLHTVERYRIQPDGTLEVSVLVEDPIAFTAPWSAKAAFEHNATYDFGENVCAENNLSISDDAIRAPSAASPDF